MGTNQKKTEVKLGFRHSRHTFSIFNWDSSSLMKFSLFPSILSFNLRFNIAFEVSFALFRLQIKFCF